MGFFSQVAAHPNGTTTLAGPGYPGSVLQGLYRLSGTATTLLNPWWVPGRPGYVPVTPRRVLDTRAYGAAPSSVPRPRIEVWHGGVPTYTKAVVLNVTVVGATSPGWGTICAADRSRPATSTINFPVDRAVANQAVVPGANGFVAWYPSVPVHLVIDVVGYMTLDSTYRPVGPTRALPRTTVPADGTVRVPLSAAGVPTTGAAAAVVNLTAVAPSGTGWLTGYATGATRPYVSNVNYVAGQTIAGMGLLPPGSDGSATVYTKTQADVIGDVAGWFPATNSDFRRVTPARLVTVPVAAGSTTTVTVAGRAGVPSSGVRAAALNVTMRQAQAPGWLTVWPSGVARPTASTVNYVAGEPISNSTMVKVGANGAVSVYSSKAGTLIVDLQGWFAS